MDTVLSKSEFKKIHIARSRFARARNTVFKIQVIRETSENLPVFFFLRRTLLTITFNQALIFLEILAKKIIF